MSMWGFALFFAKKTPNIKHNGRITNVKRISRCFSVIRTLVMHFTCFSPANITLHIYALAKSKVMKTVCLWVPGYFSCETQFMLKYKKRNCWTYPSSLMHTENQHTPSADPLALVYNNAECRWKEIEAKVVTLEVSETGLDFPPQFPYNSDTQVRFPKLHFWKAGNCKKLRFSTVVSKDVILF